MTHSWDEILNLADTVVLLESGRVVAKGSLEEVTSGLIFSTSLVRLMRGLLSGRGGAA